MTDSVTDLPGSIPTFLLTDIEGSTRLWEQHPDAMRAALKRHDALAASLIHQHGGALVKSRGEGDSLFAVFNNARDGVHAALDLQRALGWEEWPEGITLRVRMALHAGEAELRDGDYYGPSVNRCARLRSVASGRQVVFSHAVLALIQEQFPEGASAKSLGTHRLRDLAKPEQIYQLVHPDLKADFVPLKSLDALPTNLPSHLTSFIGREREIKEVKELLRVSRLVSLTGPGGNGKTRLAHQVGAELLDEFPDGVWLAEMAALTDPAHVAPAVLSALGLREEAGVAVVDQLTDYLRTKTALLLIDNCEHLIKACASLAQILIAKCATLRILATSREVLNLGEPSFRVPSLSVPDLRDTPDDEDMLHSLLQYESVNLFLDRARMQRPTFTFSAGNAQLVGQICTRLDGIPLALELAAARIKSLSVEQIASRLDQRFNLLTDGNRTALPRQQTLRAAIDWSYELLSDKERLLLIRLCLFAGGWTLEASEAVCSSEGIEDYEVLDLLSRLVDKSLVVYEEQEDQGRYRLLETIRQYGQEKMIATGEHGALSNRHRDFYLNLVEQAEPALGGREQGDWLLKLETEHDNLRAALTWSQSEAEGASPLLRLTAGLWQFWLLRGHLSEGREWLTRAIDRSAEANNSCALAKALSGAGSLAYQQGDYKTADRRHNEALAIYREREDKQGIANCLQNLGYVRYDQGDYARARDLFEKSLSIRRQIMDLQGIGASLNNLGSLASAQGDHIVARAMHQQSLAIHRQLGDQQGVANALQNLGHLSYDQSDYENAQDLHEQSLAIHRKLKNLHGTALALVNLGDVAYRRGNLAQARRLYEESLSITRHLEDQRTIAYALEGIAAVAAAEKNELLACRLFSAAVALRELVGCALAPAEKQRTDTVIAAVREGLGEEAYRKAWTHGHALPVERAIVLALSAAPTLTDRVVEQPLAPASV